MERVLGLRMEHLPASAGSFAANLRHAQYDALIFFSLFNPLTVHGAEIAPDRSVSTTKKGEQLAATVVRHHRLLERWLTDTLGLDWASADEEARVPHQEDLARADAGRVELLVHEDSARAVQHGRAADLLDPVRGAAQGCAVTVVHLLDRLMERQLDAGASALLTPANAITLARLAMTPVLLASAKRNWPPAANVASAAAAVMHAFRAVRRR